MVALDLVHDKQAAARSFQGAMYSAACADFKMACNGSTVEPSEISAKANFFCFRTDLMNPFTLTSWSSKLQSPSFLLESRICAHRRSAGRALVVELDPGLATDVAKVRRHTCMAESRVLCWLRDGRRLRAGKSSAEFGRPPSSTPLLSPGARV